MLATQVEREDPRHALVAWIREPDNPFFARAMVNRVWKQLLGRGMVEPEDDFRPTNPPSHPRLLDELAADFIRTGYDLRRLIRTIVTSRAYQRSSLPESGDEGDPKVVARYVVRRLPGPVLLDAVDRVTGVESDFPAVPRGTRAVQLPDDGFETPGGFLRSFGPGTRSSDSTCEPVAVPDLGQSLYFLNGAELQAKLANDSGRAARYARGDRADRVQIDELYLVAYSRFPTDEERNVGLSLLARRRAEGRLRAGYEDLIWAILNTPEFQYNH
ncbi:MAG: DUF1553 domain-containing protein [Mycobacteriaceae bacterium]|nr:DUF1553 domain-containing protein [Mycobacteriaceae bacterium]